MCNPNNVWLSHWSQTLRHHWKLRTWWHINTQPRQPMWLTWNWKLTQQGKIKSHIARPIEEPVQARGFEYGSLDLIFLDSNKTTCPHTLRTLVSGSRQGKTYVCSHSKLSAPPDRPVDQAPDSLICCQRACVQARFAYLTPTRRHYARPGPCGASFLFDSLDFFKKGNLHFNWQSELCSQSFNRIIECSERWSDASFGK